MRCVYASTTKKEKFSGPGENCQRNMTDLAGSEFHIKDPTTEHGTPVSRYEQLMAAGGSLTICCKLASARIRAQRNFPSPEFKIKFKRELYP